MTKRSYTDRFVDSDKLQAIIVYNRTALKQADTIILYTFTHGDIYESIG